MIDMNALRARVEQAVREIHAERQASPDPNMEGRPAVRAQLAEDRRLLSERHHAIGTAHTSVLRFTARMTQWQDARALTVRACADFEARAAALPDGDEKRAYQHGSRVLTGEAGDGFAAGACIAWCREQGVERLTSLPAIDAELAALEADLAPHVVRLNSELDAWTSTRTGTTATATMRADLPNVESHAIATVK